MAKLQDAQVDMYEQLPVPYGLVRFGVAPDHPEVKNCQEKFEEVAESPRFTYIGNVKIGADVHLADLKPHYDAILFSYGASEDRRLGIPGEDLKGVYSAREFVGWYNGLPEFQHLAPNLEAGEQAVVIGQGNVALDVARILLTPPDKLRHTDITEQALETLSRSRIRSVNIVGRRGPLQASFTVKELRELMKIDDVAFAPIDRAFYPSELRKLPRVQKRIGEVLLRGTPISDEAQKRQWALDFLMAPVSIESSNDSDHLRSITFKKQAFTPDADPLSPSASVIQTEDKTILPAALAFRSIGYKASDIPGLADLGVPFDHKRGILPNDPSGRLMIPHKGPGTLTAGYVPGLYCAGWVKRGPTGVIASTMEDAFTSADVIVKDWQSGMPFLNTEQGESASTGKGWDGVKDIVTSKGVRPVSWKDWQRIDTAERERGKRIGKEREKFGTIGEMLKVLDA
ncbi:hypothetical protein BDV96DRAFT_482643 [Lophiotrema nucula]|uniref:NADPH:adrenodoxin oxidoreductase, mitochondrial n=1 Tax=Lophiotrema nucula TaxID=690887 RepID=A0A6A5ZTE4_9PLEO|nr:hypothetical protein BDV96DRAFT_482643 [Lophiotrema nucula]